jgi:two-component system LytT family response regulator
MPVKDAERLVLVRTADVDHIEAAGNYLVLHCGKANHILRETLTNLEKSLDPKTFLRISRSALVNLDYVTEIQPMFQGEHVVILRSGKQLPMTRGMREVQERLRMF